MRRALPIFAIALLSITWTASSAGASPRDLARGNGTAPSGEPFQFTAHGTPDDANGEFHAESSPFGRVRGTVDCLFVTGNRAALSGELKEPASFVAPSGTVIVATHFLVTAEDNTQHTQPSGDLIGIAFQQVPFDCRVAFTTGFPILDGDIEVRDRTP